MQKPTFPIEVNGNIIEDITELYEYAEIASCNYLNNPTYQNYINSRIAMHVLDIVTKQSK